MIHSKVPLQPCILEYFSHITVLFKEEKNQTCFEVSRKKTNLKSFIQTAAVFPLCYSQAFCCVTKAATFLFICLFIYLFMFTSLTSWILWCKQWTSHHRKRNGTDRGCYESTSFKKGIQVKETPKCHAFKALKAGILKAITLAFKAS